MRPVHGRLLAALLLVSALPWAFPATAGGPEEDGFVVVAVVDSGINPYHAEFSAATYPVSGADFSRHPSTYLTGFPADAARLDLALGAGSYAAARDADLGKFAAVQKHRPYWIPGTKIIAAIDTGDNGFAGVSDPTPLLDDHRHGTAVASIAVGNTLGQCPRCLLVVVEDTAGLKWATEQRWIDVVVNSWGTAGNLGVPYPDERAGAFVEQFWTRAGAECGQTLVFASGNGFETFTIPEQTYTSNTLGPAWVLRIGGYVEGDVRVPMWGTGKPVDVLGRGHDVTIALHNHRLATAGGFTGTSAAAPWAGAVFAETLRLARALLHDATESTACGSQVVAAGARPPGTASGAPLADGVLTRGELWTAVLHAATPAEFTGVYALPLGVDAPFLAPVNEGFGTVDRSTAAAALAGLRGGIPERGTAEVFAARDRTLRDLLWGPWDSDGDGVRESPNAAVAFAYSMPLA